MTRRALVALGLVSALLARGLVPAADDAPKAPAASYAPVAPASAIHAALESNLKLVQHWLDGGDFTSAVLYGRGLSLLAQLYAYQSAEPRWRQQTAALRDASNRLIVAARKKNADACAKESRAVADLLAGLAKGPPEGQPSRDFKPFGAVKTWMIVLEGGYVDGKNAATAEDLRHHAHAIAEEANAVSFLRADAQWRKMAEATRAAALNAADAARGKDLDAARKAFKEIYTRCEVCHQSYQRR